MIPRPFGDWAETAFDNGYHPIPMQGKKPAVANWTRGFGLNALRRLCRSMAEANLGFLLTNLLAIDIDIQDAIQAQKVTEKVQDVLGPTPFVRVGRWPRRMLFYRVSVPQKTERIGSIEFLGWGAAAVVHGIHPSTDKPYYWPDEALLDVDINSVPEADAKELAHLRTILRGQTITRPLPKGHRTIVRKVNALSNISDQSTGRNDTLFKKLKNLAPVCRTKTDLLGHASRMNAAFQPPLPKSEVKDVVNSVWRYKIQGTLMVPGKQIIALPLTTDQILKLAQRPDELALYAVLHATRKKQSFEIPQKATGKTLGWSHGRVKKAIDGLISKGFLRELRRARGPGLVVRVVYGYR